ncbi:hypothetical protein KW842_02980 [Duganella sp. sic0402]|uniref:hypothetical protein n=1 Tax=Duganella sp. sic0402 TaxID=2854786 RepID=UPI001C472D20|nr:hypothetical protein [Duganella sp. sic0402]MBV7534722.1 hypothetical protein [Duganella sp. sic0402]
MIASRQFAKARRCAALLNYLVQKLLTGTVDSLSEHDIGIEVFGRDRSSYHTCDDPIVRVQVGRLRQRLSAFYAEEGSAERVHIELPAGSYVPRLAWCGQPVAPNVTTGGPQLAMRPLACLSDSLSARTFTSGLNDELQYGLHRQLAERLLAWSSQDAADSAAREGLQVLEGSVRQDATLTRVSLWLRRAPGGEVIWHEQFDGRSDGSIAAQEHLATLCIACLLPCVAAQ